MIKYYFFLALSGRSIHVLGKEGLIKQLSKRILERALEAEMQSHICVWLPIV